RKLHIHLNGAVEHRPIVNHHPRRLDVPSHLRARGDRHPPARVNVATRLPIHGELLGADVRLHAPGALNGEVILEGYLPLDTPLNHQVPTTGEAALDDDSLANNVALFALRHVKRPLQKKPYVREPRTSAKFLSKRPH